jgi:hypothetical protein
MGRSRAREVLPVSITVTITHPMKSHYPIIESSLFYGFRVTSLYGGRKNALLFTVKKTAIKSFTELQDDGWIRNKQC